MLFYLLLPLSPHSLYTADSRPEPNLAMSVKLLTAAKTNAGDSQIFALYSVHELFYYNCTGLDGARNKRGTRRVYFSFLVPGGRRRKNRCRKPKIIIIRNYIIIVGQIGKYYYCIVMFSYSLMRSSNYLRFE